MTACGRMKTEGINMSFEINYDAHAPVFNIQTYCIHDGPGIRDTVFVKGCPLRCLWCANPESNAAYPELMTYSSKCTGCGRCVPLCPKGAISIGPYEEKYVAVTDRDKCVNCGACVGACPASAREIAGTEKTVREVIDQVKGDKLFFDGSGGGMTISGGEALSHPDFSANLFAAAHAEGIHTAIESSAFAKREVVDRVFAHVDIALLDVKHMDSKTHERLVGVPNEYILENIRHIRRELGVPVILRMPTIPGMNDSIENLHAVGRFAASLGGDVSVNLLPYHRLGESKSESLGRPRSLNLEPPGDEEMEAYREIVAGHGVAVKIGG